MNNTIPITQHPIRVLIADDHPLCIYAFKKMFDELPEFKLIGEASNGLQLINLARNLKPDIIITDVKMPVMDGITATRQITKEFPKIRIIGLSMMHEHLSIKHMLEAGARGYISKDAQIKEIKEAITKVHNGERYYSKEIACALIKITAKEDLDVITKNTDPEFSNRELDVIKLISKEYSSKEIAEQLNLSKRTIEWHREQILHKLNANNSAAIIKYAVKNNINDYIINS